MVSNQERVIVARVRYLVAVDEVIETVKGGFISEGFFQIGSILKKNMQNHCSLTSQLRLKSSGMQGPC